MTQELEVLRKALREMRLILFIDFGGQLSEQGIDQILLPVKSFMINWLNLHGNQGQIKQIEEDFELLNKGN